MNIFAKFKDWLKNGRHINPAIQCQPGNWYESGWPLLTGDTPYRPGLIQDSRWDQNFVTRRETMRRMRDWSQNSALVESILSVGERYTVGASGLFVAFYPTDDSADEDKWYDTAEEIINEEVLQDIGWNGESLDTLLKTGYRCQKIDGDALVVKTRKIGKLQVGKQLLTLNRPCVQLVEGHRIESPFDKWEQEGLTLIDGVVFDKTMIDGRLMLQRKGFYVRDGAGAFEQESTWALLPNDAVFYLRNEHRANQPRSVSDFYSVEQDISKLQAIIKMEMRAQDAQSDWATTVENASGQFNPNDAKLQAVMVERGKSAVATDETKRAELVRQNEWYRKIFGGQTRAFKFGEKVTMHAPNRPSESTLNLIEFHINNICAGTKHPRCLVMEKVSGGSAKSQGTEVRAQLDSADGYFESDCQKWIRLVKAIVMYDLEWRVKNDPRLADPPANWRNCIHVQQPKACNVDVAYNAQAATMELASGQTNYDLIYGPRGLSFRREIKKLGQQQKLMERLKVKVTLPALLPGQIQLVGDQKQNEVTNA